MKRLTEKTNEDIKQNFTDAATQSGTERGSVTEGDKRLVETKTGKHPLDVNIIAAIQFGNALMSSCGDDTEWPSAACGSFRYASAEDCMAEDDYNGMMAALYDEADECGDFHPYFNNRNASDWTPDAK